MILTRYISFETNRTKDHASVPRTVSRHCMKISNCILLGKYSLVQSEKLERKVAWCTANRTFYFALTFFALHQTALLVTYKQYTVWYFHIKSWYSSKNRCMIFCTVCFKWNLSCLERLPVSRSIMTYLNADLSINSMAVWTVKREVVLN